MIEHNTKTVAPKYLKNRLLCKRLGLGSLSNMLNVIGAFSKKSDFKVHVTTGDKLGAGTDATVYLQLVDVSGARCEPARLDHLFVNDHERGQTHTYGICATGLRQPESIEQITLWRDKCGVMDNWFVDKIEVMF